MISLIKLEHQQNYLKMDYKVYYFTKNELSHFLWGREKKYSGTVELLRDRKIMTPINLIFRQIKKVEN